MELKLWTISMDEPVVEARVCSAVKWLFLTDFTLSFGTSEAFDMVSTSFGDIISTCTGPLSTNTEQMSNWQYRVSLWYRRTKSQKKIPDLGVLLFL
jgi:hypothetical protein